MANQEGVIKFRLDYTPTAALPAVEVRQLNAWRQVMKLLGFIGQDPARYGGYGFGNISCRIKPFAAPPEQRRFIISGTQTGHLPALGPEHYALVTACYPSENRLVAGGPAKPSAESLTHGAVYAVDPALRWVIHVHSPQLWQQAEALKLPLTRPEVPYGSPEMAAEVARLLDEPEVRQLGLFSMGGHEDGLVAFGQTAEAAGTILLTYLARALELTQQ
ncbi:MAG TPA: class II aldolase/adducin family protein [Anaerolineae bacterium]|nr:class II aldolase/adducin family protein [Anaerolineae bacterium]HMR64148.1 class II aldolase/adducin family protein [Anaerolineae bacterium]